MHELNWYLHHSNLFGALYHLPKHIITVTVAVLTFFARCEETHDGRVNASGCFVTRSHWVNL